MVTNSVKLWYVSFCFRYAGILPWAAGYQHLRTGWSLCGWATCSQVLSDYVVLVSWQASIRWSYVHAEVFTRMRFLYGTQLVLFSLVCVDALSDKESVAWNTCFFVARRVVLKVVVSTSVTGRCTHYCADAHTIVLMHFSLSGTPIGCTLPHVSFWTHDRHINDLLHLFFTFHPS